MKKKEIEMMTADEAKALVGMAYIPVSYRRTIDMLAELPMTKAEIAKELGMGFKSTERILTILHELKAVSIVEYIRTASGKRSWRYGLAEKHAKPPAVITNTEKCRTYQERRKALSGEIRLGIWGL